MHRDQVILTLKKLEENDTGKVWSETLQKTQNSVTAAWESLRGKWLVESGGWVMNNWTQSVFKCRTGAMGRMAVRMGTSCQDILRGECGRHLEMHWKPRCLSLPSPPGSGPFAFLKCGCSQDGEKGDTKLGMDGCGV